MPRREDNYAERLGEIAEESFEEFQKDIAGTQDKFFKFLMRELNSLSLRKDNTIRTTAQNRRVLRRVDRLIEEGILNEEYFRKLDKFFEGFEEAEKESEKYFSQFDNFEKTDTLKELKESFIDNARTFLTEGLRQDLSEPIRQAINIAINTNSDFDDLREQLKSIIVGESPGQMEKFINREVMDQISNYAGSLNLSVSKAIGVAIYKYAGRQLPASREFCIQRKGKYYHREEIKQWARLSWRGKRPGTTSSSIFSLRGGFNCVDHFIPVPLRAAPKSDLQRMKSKGFFKGSPNIGR